MKPGLYFLEVWGAQGCNATSTSITGIGGKGGYSSGTFVVNHSKKLYLHLGGTTNSSISYAMSYNGGGAGANINDGCGGDASDFRTAPGAWNKNFETRIIIAGGGGGAYYNGKNGGRGGGLEGESDPTNCSSVGTQNGCSNQTNQYCGKLGIGYSGFFGAGGGGKYGGGNCRLVGGGGGSGNIDGVTSHGKYEAYTGFSNHTGPGFASITAIVSFPIFTCRVNSFKFDLSLIFVLILIEPNSE